MNTVYELFNKHFVKFQLHDQSKRRFSENDLKVDNGAAANAILVSEYQRMYPDSFDVKGLSFRQYITKSNHSLYPPFLVGQVGFF